MANIILPFAAAAAYRIAKSWRVRAAASAYLSRTPAASSATQWAFGVCVKRGTIGALQTILCGWQNGSNYAALEFNAVGQLDCYEYAVGYSARKLSNAVFRDPAAWLDILVFFDSNNPTAANRVRIWVNGVEIVSWSASSNPSSGYGSFINRAGLTMYLGRRGDGTGQFDGSIAEPRMVTGVGSMTQATFGKFDAVTGQWTRLPYGGAHNTNGFVLDFADATSATTLGHDRSGNGNNWTPSGISVAAGTNFDQSNDTPTDNHAVVNGPGARVTDASGVALDNANLRVTTSASAYSNSYWPLTITPHGGAYHIETIWSGTAISGNAAVCLWRSDVVKSGIGDVNHLPTATGVLYLSNGTRTLNGSNAAYGASWTSGDRIAMEWDTASGDVTFFKNGVGQGTIAGAIPPGAHYTPVIYTFNNADPRTPSFVLNAGQQPFLDAPTSGFRALSARNLAPPSIKRAAEGLRVLLDTGANIKTACDAAYPAADFLALIKDRANANNWQAIDTLRGTGAALQTNTTAAETTYGAPSGSSAGFVWKRGAAYGFDIVTYTGNAVAGTTIAHALGAVPHLAIVKSRTLATNWYVYHRNLSSAAYQLFLNLASAQDNAVTTAFNGKAPTASAFELPGAGLGSNNNGATYVAYLWTEIPGFSRIGAFTGNGTTDGPFVWCGFKPRFVMIKRTDAAGAYWLIRDAARSPFNLVSLDLFPNATDAENNASANDTDFLSNGFKLRNTGAGSNISGGTYVFAAFAEAPFKYANAR